MTKTARKLPGKPHTSVSFSDDDEALISEALRIAADDVSDTVAGLVRRMPTSPLVERLTVYVERMTELRTRIESAR